MPQPTKRSTLLLVGGLLLTAGCDAGGGTLYQSMGALNGGPGASGASSAIDTGATITPTQAANVHQLVDTGASVAPSTGPGGFALTLSSEAGDLPAGTVLVRLTVSASDLQAPMVRTLSHSATASVATASLDVPIGSGRTLSVAAVDGNGVALARGGAGGLTVEAGRHAPLVVAMTTQLGALFGQVLNDMTGLPEPGVSVSIGDTQGVTDGFGVYRLEGLAAGVQVISFEKASFERATRSLEILATTQTDPESQRLGAR